jgi:hypothetical protein
MKTSYKENSSYRWKVPCDGLVRNSGFWDQLSEYAEHVSEIGRSLELGYNRSCLRGDCHCALRSTPLGSAAQRLNFRALPSRGGGGGVAGIKSAFRLCRRMTRPFAQ